jgi:hypothetical protein
MKEASARIKINKLLEAAGWRFFGNEHGLQFSTEFQGNFRWTPLPT